MTRSIDLYELQETDAAIDAADRRVVEIALELESEADLSGLEDQLAEYETKLTEAELERHEAEESITDQRAKLSTLEEKLYSGEVKLPRELKTLQEDVEAHQRHLTNIEAQARSGLAQGEEIRAALVSVREEREARLQEREQLVLSLQAEQVGINASLEQLRSRRDRQKERVDGTDLVLYDRLRRARSGRAVAKVERGTCQGCRITLPTTVFQRARSGLKIVQCTSCERILYVV